MIPTTKEHALRIIDIARNDVMLELEVAITKHPHWPTDILHQWAIVQEEVGEVQKEVLQLMYDTSAAATPYKLHKVREEARQVAATCLRFLAHLEIDRIEV